MPNARIQNLTPGLRASNLMPNLNISARVPASESSTIIPAGTPIGLLLSLTYAKSVEVLSSGEGLFKPHVKIVNV